MDTLAELQNSLSPITEVQKHAEECIRRAERESGFCPNILLVLQDRRSIDVAIRLAASIVLKNCIKYRWRQVQRPEDDANDWVICNSDRQCIKAQLLSALTLLEAPIQKQLLEALYIVSSYDFPMGLWPSLPKELVSMLQSTDVSGVHVALEAAHIVFKRYRHANLNDVMQELNYVHEVVLAPLLTIFQACKKFAFEGGVTDSKLRDVLFDNLRLISCIFLSLCSAKLATSVENNVEAWLSVFSDVLAYQSKSLQPPMDEAQGEILQKSQAAVCEVLVLLIDKHGPQFFPYAGGFVTRAAMLLSSDQGHCSSQLAMSGMRFLMSVSLSECFHVFHQPETLSAVCDKIIIPNLNPTSDDEELFEDNGLEYMHRDMEGFDSDTRRRSASDLISALCKHYEQPIHEILARDISVLLQEYSASPTANWRSKHIAIFLVSIISLKTSTRKLDTGKTTQSINLVDFLAQHIAPELHYPAPSSPLLTATAIKFVATFRSQYATEVLFAVVPLLSECLRDPTYVIHTYAANALERVLAVKDGQESRISPSSLAPFVQQLLSNLFDAMQLPCSHDNEYLMKAVMRVIAAMQRDITPLLSDIISHLTSILESVCRKPPNGMFSHYVFEAVACLVHFNPSPPTITTCDALLVSPMMQMLSLATVADLAPYVLQILSQLLETSPPPLSPNFKAVLPHLFQHNVVLWDKTANISPLVRLMSAYFRASSVEMVSLGYLLPTIRIVEKLVNARSKATDADAMGLVGVVLETVGLQHLDPLLPAIMRLLFERLQSKCTGAYVAGLIVCLSIFIVRHGVPTLTSLLESIQQGMFKHVVQAVWIPDVHKVLRLGPHHRRVVSLATTFLLTTPTDLFSDYSRPLWQELLQKEVQFLVSEIRGDVSSDEEEVQADDDVGDDVEQLAFSHLHFSQPPEVDLAPMVPIPDPRLHFAAALSKLAASRPSLMEFKGSDIAPATQAVILKYINIGDVLLRSGT